MYSCNCSLLSSFVALWSVLRTHLDFWKKKTHVNEPVPLSETIV